MEPFTKENGLLMKDLKMVEVYKSGVTDPGMMDFGKIIWQMAMDD